jgi:hypothetical protein
VPESKGNKILSIVEKRFVPSNPPHIYPALKVYLFIFCHLSSIKINNSLLVVLNQES